ncbi:hypothetical protein HAX54_019731, partial [Datura stramonium]|nr:hypothetical protein [Datura stramonium]
MGENFQKNALKRLQGSHAIDDALRAQQMRRLTYTLKFSRSCMIFASLHFLDTHDMALGMLACSRCKPVDEHHWQFFLKIYTTFCTEIELMS